jgi:hypothetical protein
MADKFMGVSVRGFNVNLGLNESKSQLTVDLAADPRDGDSFSPPNIGEPCYFNFGSMSFNGLLQSQVQDNSRDGNPVYSVVIEDPRDLLKGAQIITGGYNGSVGLRNVFNVFGYYENTFGFGASLRNESGMPWSLVRNAVMALSTFSSGLYGSAINFKGFNYAVDLSEITAGPLYYRVGGQSTTSSLLDLINQVCLDIGCDYFVELTGAIIKVRLISRLNQPSTGQLTSWISSLGDNVSVKNIGAELRNEPTSAMIIGGPRQVLYRATSFKSFWGFSATGTPIVGSGVGLAHAATLNSSSIAAVTGSPLYSCDVREMLCALGSQDTWALYMKTYKTALADSIGLLCPYKPVPGKTPQSATDVLNNLGATATGYDSAAISGNVHVKINALYNFVRGTAEQYLGKQYLVPVSWVKKKIEPETLRVYYSEEPVDGGYLPDGSTPLGLASYNEDLLKTPQGLTQWFVKYNTIVGKDLTRVNPADAIIQSNGLFVKAQPSQQIIEVSGVPHVLVTINSTVHDLAIDNYGDLSVIADLFQTTPAAAKNIMTNSPAGYINVKVQSLPVDPSEIVFAMKNNVLTYGPWFSAGATGGVFVEANNELVPWNYGGYTVLNLAGNIVATTAVTNLQVYEKGSVKFGGAPLHSLGDAVIFDGPNIKGIQINYGVGGVTTTYSFEIYTPRFGSLAKNTLDRIKRISNTTSKLRSALRGTIRDFANGGAVPGTAVYPGFLAHANSIINRRSPHNTLMSVSFDDGNNKRVSVSSATLEESMASCGASSRFTSSAVMSLSGLVRPVSAASSSSMSRYNISGNGNGITSTDYYPLKSNNDIEIYSWGSSYGSGNLTAYSMVAESGEQPDNSGARFFALRGPLVVTSWGYDVYNTDPVPGTTGHFASNYLRKSQDWKTGPVDLRWDDYRNVWTSNDIMLGVTTTKVMPGSTGLMTVYDGVSTIGKNITVFNWFSTGVSGNKKVIVGYSAHADRWCIISADC